MLTEIEPIVIKIAETKVDTAAVRKALSEHGWLSDYMEKILQQCDAGEASNASTLIETSGRLCYRSFSPGLNPNVQIIRTSSKDYLANIIEKGDGSILEHASVTFMMLNVSRVFTHELVRHRVGTAISQESMRYVRLDELAMWLPPNIPKKVRERMLAAASIAEQAYVDIQQEFDWDSMTMMEKKTATSAMRRILPDGMSTHIIWTANHRTIRHVLEMRTHQAAEIEMRYVFDKVGQIVQEAYPYIYQDFERRVDDIGIPYWSPTIRSKV